MMSLMNITYPYDLKVTYSAALLCMRYEKTAFISLHFLRNLERRAQRDADKTTHFLKVHFWVS